MSVFWLVLAWSITVPNVKPVALTGVKIGQKARKNTICILQKMWRTFARLRPADEGMFVQLLLSGTAIIGTHPVNFGFWYALPLRRGVGVCGGRIVRKSKFLDIFNPNPTEFSFVVHAKGHVREKFACDWLRRSMRSGRYVNKSAQSNLGRGPRRCESTMAPPNSLLKVPLPVDRSSNPTVCLIPGPVRPVMPNSIRIRSAVFPQCAGQADAPTHRPTDWQIVHGKVWWL